MGLRVSQPPAQLAQFVEHIANISNPHAVTKTQVGLSAVVNKEQVAKDGTIAMTGNLNMGANQITPVGNVDGVDVSEIKQAKIKTDTYVGNGADDRNIDIGVNLAAKANVWVLIKQADVQPAVHRIEYSQGDLTMDFGGFDDIADRIQSFTATGFQVGAATVVNDNGKTYRYVALWQEG